jgi:hypothetical protein
LCILVCFSLVSLHCSSAPGLPGIFLKNLRFLTLQKVRTLFCTRVKLILNVKQVLHALYYNILNWCNILSTHIPHIIQVQSQVKYFVLLYLIIAYICFIYIFFIAFIDWLKFDRHYRYWKVIHPLNFWIILLLSTMKCITVSPR